MAKSVCCSPTATQLSWRSTGEKTCDQVAFQLVIGDARGEIPGERRVVARVA